MKVVGIRNVDFTAQDGNKISGMSIYCSYEITKNGEGYAVEKIFLSDRKMNDCGYVPSVGDEVNITYNRFGKVDRVEPFDI